MEPYLNAVKLTMAKGGNKFTLKLSGTKAKFYRSKQSGIVSVSKRGVLTPNKKGKASILVKASNGKTYTCVVKVEDPAINYSKRMMNKGESVGLKINGTSQKVVWSSSNPKVAVVSAKGKVTAVGMGSAKITTTVNGRKFSCMITVHTHSYSKQVVKTATCTTDGSIKYTCACGANYTEKIKASGHNYQWSVGKKPSVTPAKTAGDFGTRSLMCTNCKDVKRTESIMNINGKLVYGYFDDAKALMLRGEINKQRTEKGYSDTIRQPLPAGAALESAAKLRAVEYALAQYGSGALAGVRVISGTDYMGAAYEHEESAVNAAARMCNDSNTENIFFGTEAESIGTACFYYAHNGAASTGESSGYSSYWIALLK